MRWWEVRWWAIPTRLVVLRHRPYGFSITKARVRRTALERLSMS